MLLRLPAVFRVVLDVKIRWRCHDEIDGVVGHLMHAACVLEEYLVEIASIFVFHGWLVIFPLQFIGSAEKANLCLGVLIALALALNTVERRAADTVFPL